MTPALLGELAARSEGARPHRVQLSRQKGWRMPENTVSVARPGKWGNPFVFTEAEGGRARAVEVFRSILDAYDDPVGWPAEIGELRGKNLACWCPLDQPCHADVLLELANDPASLRSLAAQGRGE